MELAVSQTRFVGLVTPMNFVPPLHYHILEDAVFLELFLEYMFFLCSSTLKCILFLLEPKLSLALDLVYSYTISLSVTALDKMSF